MSDRAPYFDNHDRRDRFPWVLYHGEINWRIARAVRAAGASPRVLIVGCGLEPYVRGGPPDARYFGCDLDPDAVAQCRETFPDAAERIAVCPSPYELPEAPPFSGDFDIVVAKEVIEHVHDPQHWARVLARRVAVGGELVLSTPNYGRWSTLPLIERTVLEWIARRDGYSRRDIHPSPFDRRRLAALAPDEGMQLVGVTRALTGWTLLGRWRRVTAPT